MSEGTNIEQLLSPEKLRKTLFRGRQFVWGNSKMPESPALYISKQSSIVYECRFNKLNTIEKERIIVGGNVFWELAYALNESNPSILNNSGLYEELALFFLNVHRRTPQNAPWAGPKEYCLPVPSGRFFVYQNTCLNPDMMRVSGNCAVFFRPHNPAKCSSPDKNNRCTHQPELVASWAYDGGFVRQKQ
ncbi:MAG: hypothetical protein QXR48_04195 [Candidatus Woesearchaeota archaeon]